MNRTWVGTIGLLALGLILWLVHDAGRRPPGPRDAGPAGIDFLIPPDYTVLELGETGSSEAAAALLGALRERDRAAAIFSTGGDRIQWLADGIEDRIDERVLGRNGTVHRVVWPDSVQVRLEWAATEGGFDVPGLPPPVRRNPYH